MAKCRYCSAPMRANNQNCEYCGVRNDVDLHGRLSFNRVKPDSDRHCPNCEAVLQTIDLKIGGELYIERCDSCFGLFFDSGEIEEALDHGVSHDHQINTELITSISEDRYQGVQSVKYRKCPVCQSFMARRNFGYRSGVVVDRCSKHGVWLDSGELVHLLEWKKAGGQIAHQQRSAGQETTTPDISELMANANRRSGSRLSDRSRDLPDLEDLVGDALSALVGSFFR